MQKFTIGVIGLVLVVIVVIGVLAAGLVTLVALSFTTGGLEEDQVGLVGNVSIAADSGVNGDVDDTPTEDEEEDDTPPEDEEEEEETGCIAPLGELGDKLCDDGHIQECTADGWEVDEECDNSCEMDGDTPTCIEMVCDSNVDGYPDLYPGEKMCAGYTGPSGSYQTARFLYTCLENGTFTNGAFGNQPPEDLLTSSACSAAL